MSTHSERWRRRGAGVLAAIVAAVIGTLVAATPARADDETCGALAGSGVTAIGLCLEDWWTHYAGGRLPDLHLESVVSIGSSATSATGCKVTAWAELDKPGSNIWSSAKVTRSCNAALQFRNEPAYYGHGVGATSGTTLNAHGCIDLYFKNSTTSGWQRCMTTGWHTGP